MTGLLSPESIIKWGIPNFKYRKNILITMSTVTIIAAIVYTKNNPILPSDEIQSVLPTIKQSSVDSLLENQTNQSSSDVLGLDGVEVELLEVTSLSSEDTSLISEQSYLKVELRIENHSDEMITYNPYQFLIENEDGKNFIPAITSLNIEDELGAGELNPGEKVTGSLVYTHDEGENPVKIQYIPIASQPSYSLNFDLLTESVSVLNKVEEDPQITSSQVVAIGALIKEAGIEYQVLSASRLNTLESSQPKTGAQYLKVEIALKNTSNDTLFVFPHHFEVRNEKNKVIKPITSLIETENLLGLSEIISGGVLQGSLLFEIPKQSTELKLMYSNPSSFKTKHVAINLLTQSKTTETLVPSIKLDELWKVGTRLVPCPLEGMQLTTYSFDFKTKTDYTQPKEGRKFLVIDVTLKNLSEEVNKYTTFDFKLLTSTGQLLMPSLALIDNQSEFKSGSLEFEQETAGQLIFEVDESDSNFSLIYSPSNWLNPQKVMIPLT